jgi:hypothetical protein
MKALVIGFFMTFCVNVLATADEDIWMQRSGLGLTASETPHLQPEQWPAGTNFAGVFTDHVVLQRAPAKAAVYGVVIGEMSELGSMGTVGVSVTVSGSASYTVEAEHVDVVNATYARWKAFLKPAPAGGEYTISAKCSGCNNTTAKTLSDVTFGGKSPSVTL